MNVLAGAGDPNPDHDGGSVGNHTNSIRIFSAHKPTVNTR